jgi:hypothetical protein
MHAYGACYPAPILVGCVPQCFVALVPVPVCYGPPAPCQPCTEIVVPRELEVDPANSPRNGLVGGHADAHLTLEYLVEDGAAAPAVEVSLKSNGTTTTWSATDVDPGYHVEEGFLPAPPGTRVTVTVTDASARLRWCERICC